jgi:hypothetical protein
MAAIGVIEEVIGDAADNVVIGLASTCEDPDLVFKCIEKQRDVSMF